MDELKNFIRTCPIIDNHAHNFLRLEGQKEGDLLAITTEGEDEAAEDAFTTLAHLRALRSFRKLYDLPNDADWETIVAKRKGLLKDGSEALTQKCLIGTETLLLDDGYEDPENVESIEWHNQFTKSPCKQIVRIETVASDILIALHDKDQLPIDATTATEESYTQAWTALLKTFTETLKTATSDPGVVGFKSIACYLTGLDIETATTEAEAYEAFRTDYLPICIAEDFDILAKPLNDYLVILTAQIIASAFESHGVAKPLQFHTGLGSNSISLVKANPAYLQPLIAEYPTVPIVLLHSAYPYTRQAGYLASVYKSCYLDIGLIFPELSRDGQETVIRQALELTPWGKLLWSTDGHYLPETYYLANLQSRMALERVLCEYVEREDLSVAEAKQAVLDMFFENSNKLYHLGLEFGS